MEGLKKKKDHRFDKLKLFVDDTGVIASFSSYENQKKVQLKLHESTL